MFADNDGPYYWHIKSGTIQREPPEIPLNSKTELRRPLVKDAESVCLKIHFFTQYSVTLWRQNYFF
jgi:hypothetical protein